jgi:chromosome partitioning protein
MSTVIVVIANHKGGVGKTTTAVSLATGLADLGYPTLLLDCDPQGNVASFLGLEPSPGLYQLVVERRRPAEVVQHLGKQGYPKLGLVAGNSTTVDLETLLRTSSRFNPRTVLRDTLRQTFYSRNGHNKPTVIVLDTAPSLSSIQVATGICG